MMQSEPLISIITTTYNHGKLIGPCINSILAQTYENWEQIIVDDGSTDGTEEIVNNFKDMKIIYCRQKHVGIYNARAKITERQTYLIRSMK